MSNSMLYALGGAAATFPFPVVLRCAFGLSAIGVLVMLFKPLLGGIARALLLAIRPHRSREELAARSSMRDAVLIQRMINASSGPSDAADLRAMAARG